MNNIEDEYREIQSSLWGKGVPATSNPTRSDLRPAEKVMSNISLLKQQLKDIGTFFKLLKQKGSVPKDKARILLDAMENLKRIMKVYQEHGIWPDYNSQMFMASLKKEQSIGKLSAEVSVPIKDAGTLNKLISWSEYFPKVIEKAVSDIDNFPEGSKKEAEHYRNQLARLLSDTLFSDDGVLKTVEGLRSSLRLEGDALEELPAEEIPSDSVLVEPEDIPEDADKLIYMIQQAKSFDKGLRHYIKTYVPLKGSNDQGVNQAEMISDWNRVFDKVTRFIRLTQEDIANDGLMYDLLANNKSARAWFKLYHALDGARMGETVNLEGAARDFVKEIEELRDQAAKGELESTAPEKEEKPAEEQEPVKEVKPKAKPKPTQKIKGTRKEKANKLIEIAKEIDKKAPEIKKEEDKVIRGEEPVMPKEELEQESADIKKETEDLAQEVKEIATDVKEDVTQAGELLSNALNLVSQSTEILGEGSAADKGNYLKKVFKAVVDNARANIEDEKVRQSVESVILELLGKVKEGLLDSDQKELKSFFQEFSKDLKKAVEESGRELSDLEKQWDLLSERAELPQVQVSVLDKLREDLEAAEKAAESIKELKLPEIPEEEPAGNAEEEPETDKLDLPEPEQEEETQPAQDSKEVEENISMLKQFKIPERLSEKAGERNPKTIDRFYDNVKQLLRYLEANYTENRKEIKTVLTKWQALGAKSESGKLDRESENIIIGNVPRFYTFYTNLLEEASREGKSLSDKSLSYLKNIDDKFDVVSSTGDPSLFLDELGDKLRVLKMAKKRLGESWKNFGRAPQEIQNEALAITLKLPQTEEEMTPFVAKYSEILDRLYTATADVGSAISEYKNYTAKDVQKLIKILQEANKELSATKKTASLKEYYWEVSGLPIRNDKTGKRLFNQKVITEDVYHDKKELKKMLLALSGAALNGNNVISVAGRQFMGLGQVGLLAKHLADMNKVSIKPKPPQRGPGIGGMSDQAIGIKNVGKKTPAPFDGEQQSMF